MHFLYLTFLNMYFAFWGQQALILWMFNSKHNSSKLTNYYSEVVCLEYELSNET